ncbi:MAG: hypothetical protein EAZ78_08870 [Oscillatoriales cyanobacterium]|nr:MAG: hypothetical protein EA000_17145 [Oscillatoriales cyanobacterium]TAD95524.1 MAG: hypothetical protein EAZ98_15430 [Oscillatoriales cyanobacterium]TAE01580.1 MAG: hypothetical protein EAZ96_18645 [Oscillatoriales cyanobacterium]TAF04477.1 MAG: hypothetical protein EAZ78_08870 [Oscillatoriales cyanobacterium]TAF32510.1 MAG: hypothetical protein EAZ68_20800 [Oscillatoriales cyanobacterium]
MLSSGIMRTPQGFWDWSNNEMMEWSIDSHNPLGNEHQLKQPIHLLGIMAIDNHLSSLLNR